jgi:hypothetical protein
LNVESPNTMPVLNISTSASVTEEKNRLTEGQIANRFLEIQMYRNKPLLSQLSGIALEYCIIQIYTKEEGRKEARLGFNAGQGSQDIRFRNSIDILFNIAHAVKVIFKVTENNRPVKMASFIVTDGVERIENENVQPSSTDYRLTLAKNEYGIRSKELTGIYPLPSRRVAAYDEYPDFFFQPQVYRADGEHLFLPSGRYYITLARGPEYLPEKKELVVPPGIDSMEVKFQLHRWIDMKKQGWYSADHHVHAAGCSHYESPEEGVPPMHMWRQLLGEDLNVAAVLTWGPGWYFQKQFFTGKDDSLSSADNIMHYDVEVSGFPSSHAGHVVLLGLKEDDYPGTDKIEQWPSWTLPVLDWAKKQGAITGYAHSGWGLEPAESTNTLPNEVMPKMDGIGANEYVVTVTQDAVDFYSAGDTPAPWELNMWYHSLNCGFRTRLSGETDFPCIYDERVGIARSYFRPDSQLSYADYIKAIKNGHSYVSEGGSHIINFSVNGLEAGTKNSQLNVTGAQQVKITADVAAFLPAHQTEKAASIAGRPLTDQPYWNIERARIGSSQKLRVELIVNGNPVDTAEMTADGKWQKINFLYAVERSAWIALRIFPSSHTNPVFISVDNKPIIVKESAEWCRKAVDQCWKMKQSNIRTEDRKAAMEAYDRARNVYDGLISAAGK